MSRSWQDVGALVLLSAGLAWTAFQVQDGWGWRLAFVATSLAGAAWVWRIAQTRAFSTATVVAGAIVCRLVVLPLPPTLSDDGYRYVWDGVVAVHDSSSPYAAVPSDERFAHRHDDVVYQRMNSPDYFSVYPAVSQAVFSIGALGYRWGWYVSWLLIKAWVVLAEVAGIWLLCRLVRPSLAALYAWHPLAIVEVAGQGHTEGLMIGALGLTAVALARKPWAAGGGIALAAGVKGLPLLLLPTVATRIGWRGLAVAAAGLAAVAAPVVAAGAVDGVRQSAGLYFGTFDLYAAPYLVVKAALSPVLGATAGSVAASGLAVTAVLLLTAIALRTPPTGRTALRALAMGVVAVWLLQSTLHPWHLLAVLWIMPLLQSATLFWICTIATVTYMGYAWEHAFTLATIVGWGGALAIVHRRVLRHALRALMRSRARYKAELFRPPLAALRPGARLLDLGAGEGHVGSILATRLGLRTVGLDVVTYGWGTTETYDGHTIPYPDDHFDACVLSFVLHHAEQPVSLVREAVRVTDGPVLILETVHTRRRSKAALERLDRFVNRLRSGGAVDESPLDIRTLAAWLRSFDENGWSVADVKSWGRSHPQALFELDARAVSS